jgi:hypothetical protein
MAEDAIQPGWIPAPPTLKGQRRFVMEGIPVERIEVVEDIPGEWLAIVNGEPVNDCHGRRLIRPYAAAAQLFAITVLIRGLDGLDD